MSQDLRPVPLNRVKIENGFWAERQRVNRERTIPAIYHQLEITGRIKAWSMEREDSFTGNRPLHDMFWDSDTAQVAGSGSLQPGHASRRRAGSAP